MVSAHIEVPFRIARTMLFLLCLVLVAFALILSSVASAQTCASRPGYPVGYWDEILTQSGYGNPCGTLAGPNYFCTAVWDFFPAYGGTTGSITPDIYPTSPDFFTSTAIQPGAAWSSQDVNGPWGRVTGTVSADGCQISVSYDGKVQDSIGTLTYAGSTPAPLEILTTTLPPDTLNASGQYCASLVATGGTGDYQWSATGLPSGFTTFEPGESLLCQTAPVTPGTYLVTLTVNGTATTASPLTLVVSPPCPVQVYFELQGSSAQGLPDSIWAQFIPPTGQKLTDYATACGFLNFAWVQSITMLPPPDGNPKDEFLAADDQSSQLSPPFFDPPLGGYTYMFDADGQPNIFGQELPNFVTAFPFYYSTEDLQTGCADWMLPSGTCTLKIESNASTLNFIDAPMSPECAYPSPCMALTTQLVGVCGSTSTPLCNPSGLANNLAQWASLPLFQWTWTSNVSCIVFSSTGACLLPNGGVSTMSGYLPPVGAVSGGVAITSINGVPSPPVSVNPSASTILALQPLSVGITVGQFQGEPVPAGTVTLTSGTYTSTAATLNGNGSANITIPAGSLPIGSDMLTVAYTPSTPVAATYSQAWGTAMVTVNPAAPQVIFVPTPSSQTYGTPIAAGSLDATAQYDGNSVTGAFVYTTGACGGAGQVLVAGATVLQAGSYSITACFTASETGLAAASATVQYSVTPASQSISFGPLAAQLVGVMIPLNATATSGMAVGFQSLTPTVCSVSQSTATTLSPGTCTILATQSGSVDYNSANPVQVSFPVTGFNLTAEPTSETIKRGVLGVFLLEVKSVNGFAGNVNISCTGGPPDSVCGDFPQTVRVRANGTTLALAGILFRPQDAEGTYTIAFTGVSGTDTSTATAVFTVK